MSKSLDKLTVEIKFLWKEHLETAFPENFRGEDIDGIHFVLLDADIAGCVSSFIDSGNLNLYQTAILGLCFRDIEYILHILDKEEIEYFQRLGRLSELVLKAVAQKNSFEHYRK